MFKTTICKDIFVENCFLNENLRLTIKEKIKNLESTCSFEHGYVIKVYDDMKLLKNSVSPEGIFVNTQFSLKTFKPTVNQVYECDVKIIYFQYVLASILGKADILIDSNNMKNYKFNKSSNSFVSEDPIKNEIKVGSKIDVKITLIRFQNQKFNCIGTLI